MGGLHSSRAMPHQDPGEASNQGRCVEHFRQGGEGCSKASQDNCEGLPSGCIEEADLEQCSVIVQLSDCLLRGPVAVGILWSGLERYILRPWQLAFVHKQSMCHG